MNDMNDNDLSKAIINLFKSVVYKESQPDIWLYILNKQNAIQDYIALLGLQLYIDEAEGYAFLKQKQSDNNHDDIEEEPNNDTLPRLIPKRPLSYPVSLLCLLLRKKLIEQDTAGGLTRVILSRDQIINMMRTYLPDSHNETKIVNQIDMSINKLIDIGFLRCLKSDEKNFEIRRIIIALIDAQWIANIDAKLAEYEFYANTLL